MKLLPVPFQPGMDQSTDPAFMGPGQLTRVENLRPTRNGRLVRRPAGEIVDPGVVGSTNLAAVSRGSNLLGIDGTLYTLLADGSPEQVGLLPLGTPVGMRDVQGLRALNFASAAAIETGTNEVVAQYHETSGRMVVAYSATGLGVNVRIFEHATGAVVYDSVTGTDLGDTTGQPTLVQNGNGIYLVAKQSVGLGGNLLVFEVDPEAGSVTFLSTLASSSAAVTHSAVALGDDASAAVVFLDGATGAVYARVYTIATGAQVGSVDLANGNAVSPPTKANCKVDVATDGTHIYTAYTDAANDEMFGGVLDGSGSMVGNSVDLSVSNVTEYDTPHISCPLGVGSAVVMMRGTHSVWGPYYTVARELANDDSVSTLAVGTSMTPMSRAFSALGRLFFVAVDKSGEAPVSNFRLFEIREGETPGFLSHLVFEGRALADADSFCHADVLSIGDELVWHQRVVLREDATARHSAAREWTFTLDDSHPRQCFEAGGVGVIPGGELTEWDGEALAEAGFLGMPEITSVAGNTSGSLTTESTYQYSMVWERTDAAGRIRRGAPADPESVTLTGAQDGATLNGFDPRASGHRVPHVAHVYRTLADGSVFYRSSALRSGYLFLGNTDGTSDDDLAERPLLYTEGGVLPYDTAPASTFGAVALGRIWLGGLFERQRIVCSTELFPGESPGFPLDGTHRLDFAAAITGLAPLDDTLVVFSETDIWIVSGDGPSITGAGGFATPRRISTDLGCTEWRSVLATSIGVFYQSRAGLMLLPRGGMQPVYVGQQIADEQETYPDVIDAALHGEGDSAVARFLLSDGEDSLVAAMHLRTQSWSVETFQLPTLGAVTPSRLGTMRRGGVMAPVIAHEADSRLIVETPGVASQTFIKPLVLTGEIAPFGFGVRFRLARLQFRGAYRGGATTLRITAIYDDQLPSQATDYVEWGIPGFAAQADGSPVRREWTPRQAECQNLRLQVEEFQNGLASSRGLDYLGLVLEVESTGVQQLQTSQRR